MHSAETKLMRRRLLSACLSSVFSITLVLLLVGVASLLMVNARNISDYFKENMQVSVIFKQQAREKECRSFMAKLEQKPYVKTAEYVSREQGIEEMENLLGADFLSVFDSAPIPISLNLSLRADYVTPSQVDSVINLIKAYPIVDDVVWQRSLVEKLNANLNRISLILAVFIALMLFISYVLIGNTMRLSLYGKRFTIHTMRLVGATKSFILGPFLAEALFQGVIASLLAINIMLGGLAFLKSQFAEMFTIFRLEQLMTVIAIMILSGVLICLVSTVAVVYRMISLKKEELYI